MKNAMGLVILATSVIVTCGLLAVMFVMYGQVRGVSSSQQKQLSSLQEEYKNADIATLDGQSVRAAEAVSLVRKYFSSMNVFVGDKKLTSLSGINRAYFGDSDLWIVKATDTTGNGAYDTLTFTNAEVGKGTPTSLSDAKTKVGAVLGSTSYSWATIFNRLNSLQSTNEYKIRIADLVGSDEAASWEDVYRDLVSYVTQAGSGGVTVPYEELTVESNATKKYSMIEPARGVAVGSSGSSSALVFGVGNCTVTGDLKNKITVNADSGAITNNSTERITVYLYSE